MTTPITASMLYDLATCSRRASMDLKGRLESRGDVNAFVQPLFEREAIDAGTITIPRAVA